MFIYLFSALTPPYYHLTLCLLRWITHNKLLLTVWGKSPTLTCKITNFRSYCFAALSRGPCYSQRNASPTRKIKTLEEKNEMEEEDPGHTARLFSHQAIQQPLEPQLLSKPFPHIFFPSFCFVFFLCLNNRGTNVYLPNFSAYIISKPVISGAVGVRYGARPQLPPHEEENAALYIERVEVEG